jgi:hypothetical protein
MVWITDHGLIDVTDLHVDPPVRRRKGTQVAGMAIAADPDGRSFRDGPLAALLQPFVELKRAPADIGVRGARHLQRPPLFQRAKPISRGWKGGSFSFLGDASISLYEVRLRHYRLILGCCIVVHCNCGAPVAMRCTAQIRLTHKWFTDAPRQFLFVNHQETP